MYEALARYTWRNFSVKYQACSEASRSHAVGTWSTGWNNRQRDKKKVKGADEHIENAESVERSEEVIVRPESGTGHTKLYFVWARFSTHSTLSHSACARWTWSLYIVAKLD